MNRGTDLEGDRLMPRKATRPRSRFGFKPLIYGKTPRSAFLGVVFTPAIQVIPARAFVCGRNANFFWEQNREGIEIEVLDFFAATIIFKNRSTIPLYFFKVVNSSHTRGGEREERGRFIDL